MMEHMFLKILNKIGITENLLKREYEQKRKHALYNFTPFKNTFPHIKITNNKIVVEYFDSDGKYNEQQPNRIVSNGHNVILQYVIGEGDNFEVEQEIVWSTKRFLDD